MNGGSIATYEFNIILSAPGYSIFTLASLTFSHSSIYFKVYYWASVSMSDCAIKIQCTLSCLTQSPICSTIKTEVVRDLFY